MIKVDYDAALVSAGKLISAAELCENNSKMVQSIADSVPEYWEGESARSFSAELNQWIRENRDLKRELERTAEMIRRTVNDLKAAEERVKTAADESSSQVQSHCSAPQSNGAEEQQEFVDGLESVVDKAADIWDRLGKFF